METTPATKTPGFNCRLSIWFTTDKNHKRVAFQWNNRCRRAVRISVTDADLFIAQGQADQISGHPMRAES